jgi:XTP/dITP diphosphohydrolase
MRKMTEPELILATHNKGKTSEIKALLKEFPVSVVSAGELHLPEPEETGSTFIENAIIKARTIAETTQKPALADDSGLCVSALDGKPGLYSARWAGPDRDFKMAMQKINEAIGKNPDRSAFFFCALALVWPDGEEAVITGRVDGTIVWPPRGDKGHGYDPFFVPDQDSRTFAEMDQAEKNRLSHRSRALRALVERHFR